jgi:LuxR family maltose regulon positive regulatory protein
MALLACSRAGLHAIDAFNGTQPELVDYFAHVVLRELPEDQRNFLMHTAMMEHFDAALCDAVMHRNDSARVIDRLLAQSLFLQPIDHLPGWYRYHPLFQSFLRSQMQIDHPDQLPVLHATIAQAWLLRGDNEIALSHAEKSEQPDFFMSTLRTACDYWSHKGDGSSIIRWLSPMADELILADRDLSIALISALILSRRFNQARYYLDASANITHDNPLDDSTRAFLELMLQVFQHDTDFRLNADQAMLISSSQHHDIRAFSLAMLAYHHLLHGEFSDALVYADQSKTVLEQLGYDYLSSYADLILILCDRNTGRLLHASQNAELNFRKQQHCAYTQPWINAATAAAVVRYEQNRTQEALSLLEKLVPVVNSSCATEIIVYTYLILARLLRCRHEKPRASRLLAQLSRILQMGNYDRFVSQVVHEELLHAWASNDIDAMDRVADTHQLEARLNNGTWRRSRDYDEAWERYGMATALWLTAHQRFEEAEHTLEVILGALKKSGAHSRAVVTEANLVLIRHQMGDDNVALHRLKRLIDQYSIICINRTVYDEAPGLNRFLKRCHDVGNLPLPSIYADMFRNLLEDTSVQTDTPKTDAALLTAKEQEVLTLLCNGLSNNEISNRIGVALSTTKWHLKNIFAKMGVANRTAAILQASQNGNTLRTQLWVAATTASVTLTELPIPALL